MRDQGQKRSKPISLYDVGSDDVEELKGRKEGYKKRKGLEGKGKEKINGTRELE